MDRIGLDLHKSETQVCTLTADGELIEQRIRTSRERFTALFGGARPPAHILVEASTESEWVARHLEALGHTVIVADPGFAPMYATRSSRVKTDKRDARTLCDALRLGAYRAIHRASDPQREIRAALAIREALVRTRTRYVALIKAAVRREGLRLTGTVERIIEKLHCTPLPAHVGRELAPLVALCPALNAEIAAADHRLEAMAKGSAVVRRLATVPGIGFITALAFVAALDDVTRFPSAHQVEAYLGLVPSEYSSGDRRQRGRITKRGDVRTRWLLVEAGWRILRSTDPEVAALKAWGDQLARRRGKAIAAVALARRLAGILYAMWRDETDYRPSTQRSAA